MAPTRNRVPAGRLARLRKPGTTTLRPALQKFARIAVIAAACVAWADHAAAEETWILIDTDELTLKVMRGEATVRSFGNVSIGRNGATSNKLNGDKKTPVGTFRVVRVNEDSPYHRFFAFDYPDLQYALRAFEEGVIDAANLKAIREAHEHGLEPPADTPLGGYIGIHGLGEGDARFHEDFNWTEGCVALTNDEIDELGRWLRLGTLVVVL